MPIARRIWAESTSAKRPGQREHDKIGHKSGEADHDRRPLGALERPPNERAHNHDFEGRRTD